MGGSRAQRGTTPAAPSRSLESTRTSNPFAARWRTAAIVPPNDGDASSTRPRPPADIAIRVLKYVLEQLNSGFGNGRTIATFASRRRPLSRASYS